VLATVSKSERQAPIKRSIPVNSNKVNWRISLDFS
jgi:hypothetical protein